MLLQKALFHYFSCLSTIPLNIYIYTHTTSPLSIQTIRLLPCLGYYKQCCNGHWSAYIFSHNGFLWIYAQG